LVPSDIRDDHGMHRNLQGLSLVLVDESRPTLPSREAAEGCTLTCTSAAGRTCARKGFRIGRRSGDPRRRSLIVKDPVTISPSLEMAEERSLE
jgi:hypothetical protein